VVLEQLEAMHEFRLLRSEGDVHTQSQPDLDEQDVPFHAEMQSVH
jgi:hypothetical protein